MAEELVGFFPRAKEIVHELFSASHGASPSHAVAGWCSLGVILCKERGREGEREREREREKVIGVRKLLQAQKNMPTFALTGETKPMRRTKRALLNGGGRYSAVLLGQRWKPKQHLDGAAWHLRALVKQSSCPTLRAGHRGVRHAWTVTFHTAFQEEQCSFEFGQA